MKKAADFMLDINRRVTFNQASCDEFVHSESAGGGGGAAFCFDDLNDFDNPAAVCRNIIADRLMGEIRQARDLQEYRDANFSERGLPEEGRILDLTLVAEDWQRRKRNNTSQQLASLFRYLLIRMTDPPDKIKEFSFRKNKQTGRDATLKNLPHHTETTLIGFGEDLLGYGHDAPKSTPGRVLIELGASDGERRDRFAQLKRERRDWRGSLFKALQLAV
ncbi:hypothetical protein Aduo_018925 [Ancylostoma duodenale]